MHLNFQVMYLKFQIMYLNFHFIHLDFHFMHLSFQIILYNTFIYSLSILNKVPITLNTSVATTVALALALKPP